MGSPVSGFADKCDKVYAWKRLGIKKTRYIDKWREMWIKQRLYYSDPASIQLMTVFVPFKLADNLFGLI